MSKERIPRTIDEDEDIRGKRKGPAKRLSREEKEARRALGVPVEIATVEAERAPHGEDEKEIQSSRIPDSGQPWLRAGVIESPMMRVPQTVQMGAENSGPKQQQAQTDSDSKDSSAAGEADPRWKDRKIILDDAHQILRDRKDGKTDEEITKLLEEVGYPQKVIRSRFRAAAIIGKEIEAKRERAQKIASQTPETKKALEILEAAAKRPISSEEVPAPLAASAPGGIPSAAEPAGVSESEAGIDSSDAVNPFMLRPDAQEDYDALKADIHASEDQRKKDEEIEKFKASGLMRPMPEAASGAHSEEEGVDAATTEEPEALSYTPESELQGFSRGEEESARQPGEKGVHGEWGEYEDIKYRDISGSSVPEGTPKEWREKLRSLIEGAKDTLGAAKEKVDWWKSAEEGLIRRNAELDADAEKIGGVEKLFRSMGEKYNKMPFKYKVAAGAMLGLGTIATAGTGAIALPLALIAGQRVAGLSTMYLKFEKKSHDEAWGKEKALLKAGVYTVLMGLAMKEAIEYASETEFAHSMQAKVSNWLGSMFEHRVAPGAAPAQEMQEVDAMGNPTGQTTHIPAPEQPAAAAAAGEAAKSAVAPEISGIEVKASPGHGYEYMTKRLWEQLQEKHISLPQGANPDSDLAKLLAADKDAIDKVVHQLAQENKFFNPDGTSVLVTPDSHIHLDSSGNILIQGSNLAEGGNLAPSDTAVTPAYHPETAGADTPAATEGITETETAVPVPPDAPFAHPDYPVADSGGIAELPPVVDHDFIVNTHEVTVPLAEPHIYSDGKNLMIYGGLPKDQMPKILSFLTAHPDSTLFSGEDTGKYRVSWKLVEGKLVPGAAEKARGFRGLFGSFASPPTPDEFTKVVE